MVSLPRVEQPTHGKGREIGSVCQLLIGDSKIDPICSGSADSAGEGDENMCQTLSRTVTDQAQVRCQIPHQIVAGNG